MKFLIQANKIIYKIRTGLGGGALLGQIKFISKFIKRAWRQVRACQDNIANSVKVRLRKNPHPKAPRELGQAAVTPSQQGSSARIQSSTLIKKDLQAKFAG